MIENRNCSWMEIVPLISIWIRLLIHGKICLKFSSQIIGYKSHRTTSVEFDISISTSVQYNNDKQTIYKQTKSREPQSNWSAGKNNYCFGWMIAVFFSLAHLECRVISVNKTENQQNLQFAQRKRYRITINGKYYPSWKSQIATRM